MGKFETLAGLLTLLAGLIGAATAGLELAKAALELRRARWAGRSVTGEADDAANANTGAGTTTPLATRRPVAEVAGRCDTLPRAPRR